MINYVAFITIERYYYLALPRQPARLRSPTRTSRPIRCAGKSPRSIIRRTVFGETSSLTATSATLRNRSPGSGDAFVFVAVLSGRFSSSGGPHGDPAGAKGVSKASLTRLKASRAACRAIVRMRRVKSSSPSALTGGSFPPMGRRLVMSGRYSPRVWRRQPNSTYALSRKGLSAPSKQKQL